MAEKLSEAYVNLELKSKAINLHDTATTLIENLSEFSESEANDFLEEIDSDPQLFYLPKLEERIFRIYRAYVIHKIPDVLTKIRKVDPKKAKQIQDKFKVKDFLSNLDSKTFSDM